jgi:peptide-methionine (S)-S-oxide reductase
MEKATFAAGCFWGIESVFSQIPGVISTRVGYTGGDLEKPNYEQVCRGNTGHAEAVEVVFDPEKVSYEKLLKVFWNCHSPTSLNKQGLDEGSQYRSALFCHTPAQLATALDSKEELQLSKKYRSPIVTQITPAGPFHPAEEYHQKYLEKQGIKHCWVDPEER